MTDRDLYSYLLVPAGPGRPLLVLFHGTGGSEHQLAALGRELLPQAGLLAPRGDVSEEGAARFFRRTGEGVYDMDDLARATAKMAAFVRAHAAAERPSSLLGLGYSNGANVLASVLFAEPGLFDAAVLMHPLIPFEPAIEEGRLKSRVLITAGRHDPICPPALTARLEAWLRAKGADVALEWHEGGHDLRQNEVAAARAFLAPYGGGLSDKEGSMMQDEDDGIVREEGDTKGRYVYRADGAEAELTFSRLGTGRIIIDHTGVPDAFRGKGVGLKLVERAVADARAEGRKIIPLCPFAKAQFGRHAEWADVLSR